MLPRNLLYLIVKSSALLRTARSRSIETSFGISSSSRLSSSLAGFILSPLSSDPIIQSRSNYSGKFVSTVKHAAILTQAKTATIPSSSSKLCMQSKGTNEAFSSSTMELNVPSVELHAVDIHGKKRNDVRMPIIGLGTYKFSKGTGEACRAVQTALSLGYRHIDTAFIYGGEQTEGEVGKALSSVAIPRKDIFVTTKQWRAHHGYDATTKCLDISLNRLRTNYVDLYLIHWPGPAYTSMCRSKELMENSSSGPFVYAKQGHDESNITSLRAETWRAMEDAVFAGKCRAIGVSNFTIRHLETLKKTARVWPPAVNQVELHPYNPQSELVEYCRKEGIVVQAYASLGGQDSGEKTWKALGGKLIERVEVKDIAKKYGRTEAQVLLRWATQQGFVVIPKSTCCEHMRQNLESVLDEHWGNKHGENRDIGLIEDDMKLISGLDQVNGDTDGDKMKVRLCWVRDPLKMLDFE